MIHHKLPDSAYEKEIIKKGFKIIAGIDEVGRGCFAGPVVAGCVVFRDHEVLIRKMEKQSVRIDDSKKLNKQAREKAAMWISENCIWGIGSSSVTTINRLGITKATNLAFRKAINNANQKLGLAIDFLLIDAFYIPYVKGLRRNRQLPLIKGDSKSLSIAAASVIAKVYRDELMTKLGCNKKFSKYNWALNKGYGTKDHREAILKYGVTNYHRKKFITTFYKNI